MSGAEKDKERIRKRRKERAERRNESDKEMFGGSGSMLKKKVCRSRRRER